MAGEIRDILERCYKGDTNIGASLDTPRMAIFAEMNIGKFGGKMGYQWHHGGRPKSERTMP